MHFENLLPLLEAWPVIVLVAGVLLALKLFGKGLRARAAEHRRYEAAYWKREHEHSLLMRFKARLLSRKTKRLTYQPTDQGRDGQDR